MSNLHDSVAHCFNLMFSYPIVFLLPPTVAPSPFFLSFYQVFIEDKVQITQLLLIKTHLECHSTDRSLDGICVLFEDSVHCTNE